MHPKGSVIDPSVHIIITFFTIGEGCSGKSGIPLSFSLILPRFCVICLYLYTCLAGEISLYFDMEKKKNWSIDYSD